MNAEQWRHVVDLHGRVCNLSCEERDSVLAQHAGEPGIVEEVRALLVIEPPDDFIEPFQFESRSEGLDIVFGGGLAGTRVGEFVLEREIGRGGMGVVYLAEQRELGRQVAVKVLPLARLGYTDSLERFRREAKALSSLAHPRIANVLAYGEGETTAWYAMRHVAGHDLAVEIAAQARGEGRRLLPDHRGRDYVPAVVRRVAELADAIQHAHDLGIVHRDIKPANILLDEAGAMNLVDFGLARDARFADLSRTGEMRGTPHYMSPEQVKKPREGVRAATDVYSLGVVLYEALSLRRPFDGQTTLDVFHAIERDEPVPLRRHDHRLHRDLEAITFQALRKDSRRRYASARELAADLERFLAHESPKAKPRTALDRLASLCVRHGLRIGLAAAVLAALFLVWRLSAIQTDRSRLETALATLPTAEDFERVGGLESEAARGERAAFLQRTDSRLDQLELEFEGALEDPRFRRTSQDLRVAAAGLLAALQRPGTDGRRGLPGELDLIGRLQNVAGLFGIFDDPESQTLLRELLDPRVHLLSEPPGALARATRLDSLTEMPVPETTLELGTTPVDVALEPGPWRFRVETPDGRFGEITTWLEEYGLECVLPVLYLRDVEDVVQDMLLVPAGDFHPGVPTLGVPAPVDPVPMAAFYVDLHEVTNAEYRAFCLDTGTEPPSEWPATWREAWDSAWDDYPATWVDVYQAEAFAAWAGKRLPVALEWDRVARGRVERRLFPWGDAPQDVESVRLLANVRKPQTQDGGSGTNDLTQTWEHYLTVVEPVGAFASDVTPEGVHDLAGNVREWTTSRVWMKSPQGSWVWTSTNRMAKGNAWITDPLTFRFAEPIHASARSNQVGFRCVRTID